LHVRAIPTYRVYRLYDNDAKPNLPEELITIIVANKVAPFIFIASFRALVSPMTWKWS